jgi:hypothetical protein
MFHPVALAGAAPGVTRNALPVVVTAVTTEGEPSSPLAFTQVIAT